MDIKVLEQRSELADARLGVAEDFGWAVAGLSSVLAGVSWHWLAGVIILLPVYFTITKPYRTAATRAEDAYHLAASIGKYSRAFRGDDA
ncbi:MAG: hypothetical protein ACK4NM_07610 [Hydrogenophaga sp.]